MNPRLTIETPRLTLRMPQPDDVRSVQLAIQLTLPELARWMPQALKGQTQAQTRAYIYTQMALFVQDENLTFGMFDKANNVCLGIAELGLRVPRLPSWEMSFWTRSDLAGQGYMSEAAQALLNYAFDSMHAQRVFLRTEPANEATCRVAEKIGMLREGCLKNDAMGVDGQTPVDTLIYGLTPAGRMRS